MERRKRGRKRKRRSIPPAVTFCLRVMREKRGENTADWRRNGKKTATRTWGEKAETSELMFLLRILLSPIQNS